MSIDLDSMSNCQSVEFIAGIGVYEKNYDYKELQLCYFRHCLFLLFSTYEYTIQLSNWVNPGFPSLPDLTPDDYFSALYSERPTKIFALSFQI